MRTALATRGLAATSARSRQRSEPTSRRPSGRVARGLSTTAASRRWSSDQGGVEAVSSRKLSGTARRSSAMSNGLSAPQLSSTSRCAGAEAPARRRSAQARSRSPSALRGGITAAYRPK